MVRSNNVPRNPVLEGLVNLLFKITDKYPGLVALTAMIFSIALWVVFIIAVWGLIIGGVVKVASWVIG